MISRPHFVILGQLSCVNEPLSPYGRGTFCPKNNGHLEEIKGWLSETTMIHPLFGFVFLKALNFNLFSIKITWLRIRKLTIILRIVRVLFWSNNSRKCLSFLSWSCDEKLDKKWHCYVMPRFMKFLFCIPDHNCRRSEDLIYVRRILVLLRWKRLILAPLNQWTECCNIKDGYVKLSILQTL